MSLDLQEEPGLDHPDRVVPASVTVGFGTTMRSVLLRDAPHLVPNDPYSIVMDQLASGNVVEDGALTEEFRAEVDRLAKPELDRVLYDSRIEACPVTCQRFRATGVPAACSFERARLPP